MCQKEEQGLHSLFELREKNICWGDYSPKAERNFKRSEAGCPAQGWGFLPGSKASSPTCIK